MTRIEIQSQFLIYFLQGQLHILQRGRLAAISLVWDAISWGDRCAYLYLCLYVCICVFVFAYLYLRICICVFVFAFVFVFAGYNKQSSIVPDRGGNRLLLYRSFFNCTLSLPQVITFLGQRRSLREAPTNKNGEIWDFYHEFTGNFCQKGVKMP